MWAGDFSRLFLTAEPVAAEGGDLYASGLHFTTGDQIEIHAVFLIDPGNLVVLAEIVNTDELVHTARSSSACFPVFQCTLSAA